MDESRYLRDRPRTCYPNCLPLALTLRSHLTLAQRKRFFLRLYEQARQLGLVYNHAQGRCLFFGAERICGSVHRHQLANWLSDQVEVTTIHLGQLESLYAISTGKGLTIRDPAMTRGQVNLIADAYRDLALRVARHWYHWLEGRIR